MSEKEELCQRLELWARRVGNNHSMYDGRGDQPTRILAQDLLEAVEYIRFGSATEETSEPPGEKPDQAQEGSGGFSQT